MKRDVIDNTEVWCVTEAPNWVQPVEGRFSVVSGSETSLTGREGRRPYSATLRCQLRYTALVAGAGVRELTAALRPLTTQPVLMPFWPVAIPWPERAQSPIRGGLAAVWSADGSRFSFYVSGLEPAWPGADALWAPALWGDLGAAQSLHRWHDELLEWTVDFTEGGPPAYALLPPPTTPTPGPQPPGYSVPPEWFPFVPNWDRVTDQFMLRIRRETVGFRRQRTPTFYPQVVAQANEAGFLLTSSVDIGRWLRFLRDHAAGTAFWMPAWSAALRLTADVAPSDRSLAVADTTGLAAGDFVGLMGAGNSVGRQIVSVDSLNRITVNVSFGTRFPAATTSATPLLLVRMDRADATVEWSHTALATVRISVRELPTEYDLFDDGGLNPAMGSLPARAVLFTVTSSIGELPIASHWTNYESDLTWAGQVYTSADFAHGELVQSLDLERTGVDLTSRLFSGNPLVPLVNLTAEGPVKLIIQWATVTDRSVTDAVTVFTGEAIQATLRGLEITARFAPGGMRLDGQVPRQLRGPTCSATLFHDGCGLLPADWRWQAAVAGPVVSDWPFQLTVVGLAGPQARARAGADWFVGGWIEWGTGSALQRRPVVASAVPVGDSCVLTLGAWFEGLPAPGDPIALYPGCDQQRVTCQIKFYNYLNFRGHPFIPAGNPTLVKRSDSGSGGKK